MMCTSVFYAIQYVNTNNPVISKEKYTLHKNSYVKPGAKNV